MRKILRVTKRVFAGALAAVFLLTSIPDSTYAIENDIPIESLEVTENSEEVIVDSFDETAQTGIEESVEIIESEETEGLAEETEEAEGLAEETEETEGLAEETEETEGLTEEAEEVDELTDEEAVVDEEAASDEEVEALKDGKEVRLTAGLAPEDRRVEGELTVADFQDVIRDDSTGSFKGQLFPDDEGKFWLIIDYTAQNAGEGYTFCYKVGESEPTGVVIDNTTHAGIAKIAIPMVGGKNTSTLSMYVENNSDPKECVSDIAEYSLDLFGYTPEMVNLKVEPFGADDVLPDCENEKVVYEKGTKASRIQGDVSFAEGKVSAKLFPVEKDGSVYYYLAGKLFSDVEGAKYVVNKDTPSPDCDGDENGTFLIPFVEGPTGDLKISVLYNNSEIAKYTYTLGENVKLLPSTTVDMRLPSDYYKYGDVPMSDYQKKVQLGTDNFLYGEINYKDGYHLGLDVKSNADITVKINGEEVSKASSDDTYDFYFIEVSSSSDVITVSAQSDETYGVEERKIYLSKLKFEQQHNTAVIETVNVDSNASYPVMGAISDSLEFVIDGVAYTPDSPEEDVNTYDVQIGDRYTVIATAKPGTKIVSYQVDQISEEDPDDVILGKEVIVKNNKLSVTGTVQAGYRPHIRVKIEDTLELTLWHGNGEDTECQKDKDTYIIDQFDPYSSEPFQYYIEQYSYLLDDIVPIVDRDGGTPNDRIVIMDGNAEIPMKVGEDYNYIYGVSEGLIQFLKFRGDCFAPGKDYTVKLQRYDEETSEFYDSQSLKLRFSSNATSLIFKNGGKTVSTINLIAGSYVEYDYTIAPSSSTGMGIEFNIYHPDGTELSETDWDYCSLNFPELYDGKYYLSAELDYFKAYCEEFDVDKVSYIIKPGYYNDDESFTPLKNGKAIKVNIEAPKQIAPPAISSEGLYYDENSGKYLGYNAKITLPKSVNKEFIPCYYVVDYKWYKGDGNEPISGWFDIFPDEDTGLFETEYMLDYIDLPLPTDYNGTQVPKLEVNLYQQDLRTEPGEDTRLSSSYAEKEFSEYWASTAKDMTVKQVAKTVYTGQQNVVLANVKYSDKVTCKGAPDVFISILGLELNLNEEDIVQYDPVSGDVSIVMIPDVSMFGDLVEMLLGKQKLTIKAPAPQGASNEVSKTISVNIVKGIDSLDISAGNISASEYSLGVYKPAGKAVSVKFNTEYNIDSQIAPKTKKATYVVYDSEDNVAKGVTAKNGKITIDKSYNVKDPKNGDFFMLCAYAADYEGNETESIPPFGFYVYAQKPVYEELLLVEQNVDKYEDWDYHRIDSSVLTVDDVVGNDGLSFVVRTSSVPVKDTYELSELLLAPGNFTVKSSNKKVVVEPDGCGILPLKETVKGVTFTATATDGSKATVKSGKYDIVSSCDRDDFAVEIYDEADGYWYTIDAGSTVMLSGKNSEYIELQIYGIDEDDERQYNIQLDMTVSVKNGYVNYNDGYGYYSIIPANSKPVTVTVTDKAVKPQIKKVYTFKQRNDVTITAKPDRTINMESTIEDVRIDVTFPDGYEPAYYDENNVSATADAASLLYFTYFGKENTYYDNFINCINDDAIYNWYGEEAWRYGWAAFLRKDEIGYFVDINVSPYGVPLKKGKYSLSCFIVDRDGVGEDLSTGAIPLTFEVKQTKVGFNPSAKGTKFTMSFDEKIEWTKTSKTLDKVEFMYCGSQVVDGKANDFAVIFMADEDGTLIINPETVSYGLNSLTYNECVDMIKKINKNSTGYVEYEASLGNAYKVGMMLVNINVKIPTEEEYISMKQKWNN